jgi:hypothetical protein
MSPEQRDAAILRNVKQRAEVKQDAAVLQRDIREAAKALAEIGKALERFDANYDLKYLLALVEKHSATPSLEKLAAMMKAYIEAQAQLGDLQNEAVILGIG